MSGMVRDQKIIRNLQGKTTAMKQSIHVLFLTTVLLSLSFHPVVELPVGASLPLAEQKLEDIRGGTISLADALKENGLLVMFSCNTCPYVVKNQKRTLAAGKEALQKNIGVVLINSNEGTRAGDDSKEAMKKYAKAQGYQWPYLVDAGSRMADAFGARRTPECYLFNGKGKLVYQGAIDDNPSDAGSVQRNHLQLAMKEMLSGKNISLTQTRSVGCAIKRKS